MNRLGDDLKHEREKRKIPLEYIAAKTNLTLHTLIALENNQFSEIPSGFYFKNYIKAYLNAIDANADEFLETHREEIAASCSKKGETSDAYCNKLVYSRFKRRNIFFIFLITVVFIGLLVYAVYSKKEAIFSSWSDWKKEPVEVSIPQSGIDFNALHLRQDSHHDYSPLNLAIEFSGRCWVQVNRGKEKILEQTFQKGETLAVAGYELSVLMDNPARLRFLVNGKEVSYLRNLTEPEKITITPVTIGKFYEK